jgi:hypothetical protein
VFLFAGAELNRLIFPRVVIVRDEGNLENVFGDEIEIRITAKGSQMCSNFTLHMSFIHCACSLFEFPYHDDDAICLFHVCNCQFTLLFPLNAFN